MSSVNKCLFIGNLAKDPELRMTPSGKAVCSFTLAVNSGFGEQKHTEWVNVVVWEKKAELCSQYLSKGRQCYIEGRMQTRSYDDKNGEKRYRTEIIANDVQFLGSKQSGGGLTEDDVHGVFGKPDASDDDVPFISGSFFLGLPKEFTKHIL